MLIAIPGVHRVVAVVPVLWAVVGSLAAFLLGITADTALSVAAVLLTLDLVAPSVLGRTAA
jgi:hypothetical protein